MSAYPINLVASCCTLSSLNNATRPHVWIATAIFVPPLVRSRGIKPRPPRQCGALVGRVRGVRSESKRRGKGQNRMHLLERLTERVGLSRVSCAQRPRVCASLVARRGHFWPRAEPSVPLDRLTSRGLAQARPEEGTMAPHSSEESPNATSVVIVATLWAAVILFFALHSALN